MTLFKFKRFLKKHIREPFGIPIDCEIVLPLIVVVVSAVGIAVLIASGFVHTMNFMSQYIPPPQRHLDRFNRQRIRYPSPLPRTHKQGPPNILPDFGNRVKDSEDLVLKRAKFSMTEDRDLEARDPLNVGLTGMSQANPSNIILALRSRFFGF
ncbi:UNVERIFIED_CONTAM: hypothetical protein HDU68_005088 [Siphonaria sp. JEL0065]|nr:hypothetical protein HDU68_005088 [Siphonaria sp. JEL0065]